MENKLVVAEAAGTVEEFESLGEKRETQGYSERLVRREQSLPVLHGRKRQDDNAVVVHTDVSATKIKKFRDSGGGGESEHDCETVAHAGARVDRHTCLARVCMGLNAACPEQGNFGEEQGSLGCR